MPLSVEQIAGALIEHVDSSDARELLFGKAALHSYQAPALTGPLSKEFALKFYKKDLDKVLVIARDKRTDPEVLGKFAKDTRVSVRTELLVNPSTPYEAILPLVKWAFKRGDWPVLSLALERLTTDDLAAFLIENCERLMHASWSPDTGYYCRSIGSTMVARKLSSNRKAVLDVAALQLPTVTPELALLAHHGGIPSVTAAEIIETAKLPHERASIAVWIQRKSTLLTADVARHLPNGHHLDADEVAMCDPEALAVVSKLSGISFRAAIVLGLPEDDVLEIALGQGSPWIAPVVEAMKNGERVFSKTFERSFVETMLDRWVNPETGMLPEAAFELPVPLKHRLPDALIESLIRALPYRTLHNWFVSKSVNAPRPGQLSRIFASPGKAFHDAQYSRYSGTVQMTEHSGEQIAEQLLRSANYSGVRPELVREFMKFVDPVVLRFLYQNAEAAKLVASAAQEAFVDDSELWSTFLVLAADWSGSFSDLLSATGALTGKPLHAREEPAPEVRKAAKPVEDLVLV